MTSENDEIAQLDNVLTELVANARGMARDLVYGVDMTRLTSRLLFCVAMLGMSIALVDLAYIPFIRGGQCCYTLTFGDLAGGVASAGLFVVGLWQWLRVRRKYFSLRVRYNRLLEIEKALQE